MARNTNTPFLTLDQYIHHAINREYMSGVERDKARTDKTGEVFTPDDLVQNIIEQVIAQQPTMFSDPTKTLLDPACGDGQFLVWGVLYKIVHILKWDEKIITSDNPNVVHVRKTENIFDEYKQAIETIYGVELMPDNVAECKRRLNPLKNRTIKNILDKHIVCANSLEYDFSFQ